MNKFVVTALSLGLLGGLTASQAATVSVDAGTYIFSYDDGFLAGSSFSSSANTFTFGGLNYLASALGGVAETGVALGSANGYGGVGYPITITAKAGYQITGLSESVSGHYLAVSSTSPDSYAAVSGSLVSRWVYADGVVPLGQNTPSYVGSVLAGEASIDGGYTASGSLNFTPVIASEHLAAGGSIVLSSLDVQAFAMAHGYGSGALVSLNQYTIGVQTTAVPEPQTLALVLAGLGVLGLKRGRRNTH